MSEFRGASQSSRQVFGGGGQSLRPCNAADSSFARKSVVLWGQSWASGTERRGKDEVFAVAGRRVPLLHRLLSEQADENLINQRTAFGEDAINDADTALSAFLENHPIACDPQSSEACKRTFQRPHVTMIVGQPFDRHPQPLPWLGCQRFDERLDLFRDADFSLHRGRRRP